MTMRFIEHIIEPQTLLLAWQSTDEEHRTRYIVGELKKNLNGKIDLNYLTDTKDFQYAKKHGFVSYPAFQNTNQAYNDVQDAFMRRVPPRTRGDFDQYLEGLRIKPNTELSDFALLGYSGAKLPSDGFSLIHPFNHVAKKCELLTEAAGFRHVSDIRYEDIETGDPVKLVKGQCTSSEEVAVEMKINNQRLGYVNRGLVSTFTEWLNDNRIISAWVEKKNGMPGRPAVYVYVQVDAKH